MQSSRETQLALELEETKKKWKLAEHKLRKVNKQAMAPKEYHGRNKLTSKDEDKTDPYLVAAKVQATSYLKEVFLPHQKFFQQGWDAYSEDDPTKLSYRLLHGAGKDVIDIPFECVPGVYWNTKLAPIINALKQRIASSANTIAKETTKCNK